MLGWGCVLKSVDLLKFFFCLCVVALHCDTLDCVDSNIKYYVTQGVFRLAVPFFFVASGFFLARKFWDKAEEVDCIYKRYIKRLLIPLFYFSLINIVFESIKMSSYVSGPFIFREIIKHVVFYPWGALWFLQACIVGVLLLYPFAKRNKVLLALLISFVMYVWALVCNNYFFLVQGTFIEPYVQTYMNLCISARNGIFVGFIYLSIGFVIAKKKIQFSNVVMILVLGLYLLEIYLLRGKATLDDSALYISQLLVVPVIFIKALNFPLRLSEETCVMYRHFSVGVYLLHRPVLSCLDICGLDYIPCTFVVFVVCIGVCYLVQNKNTRIKKILF